MRTPRSTYRLQFNKAFTFSDAAELVPYLADLGISDLYASPFMEAHPGSMHGYDIVDHNSINPEVGGRAGLERLSETLRAHGMGHLLDWVPNHMGVGPDNPWWMDALENGPASPRARFFDIDWRPTNRRELDGKVLLPVLGGHYREVLENGELELAFDSEGGSFFVSYYEHRCPIDPGTYPEILEDATVGEEHTAEFESVVTAFGNLPGRDEANEESTAERMRDSTINKERLARMCADSPSVASAVEGRVEKMNGDPEALHYLLENQAYRLVFWRVASDEINYRRFFSINELAGIRVEDDEVFAETHRLVLELLREGTVSGLRLDHPDGLYDSAGYFRRLQSAAKEATGEEIYLLVEKILAGHESLPEDWRVCGTTGYEFTNLVNGVFVDAEGEGGMTRAYERFIGRGVDFDELLYECKKRVMRGELASELNVLSRRLLRLADGGERRHDFTINVLRNALSEVVAYFPVYRTYVVEEPSETDRRYIEWAVARARKRSDAADTSVFDFIHDTLLVEGGDTPRGHAEGSAGSAAHRRRVADFVGKFQQYTGPVMAKGMEDTALYRYNRLASLNEVGGEPEHFGTSVSAFHHMNAERMKLWPHAMLSTSTHDTKRGEDVRARINVLSEMPDEWRANLAKWARINRSRRRETENGIAPSRNDEYLLYQTLLGAWPLEEEFDADEFAGRVKAYMEKAMREAEVHTSWTNADEEYEAAVSEFVEAILVPDENNLFLHEFVPFQRRVARVGAMNSLSQTLLKLTVPGVPDIYQGNELWDFSLVDPDNRRPVDYELRRRLLAESKEVGSFGGIRAMLEDGRWQSGLPKMHLTRKVLNLRNEKAELFECGEYVPLEVSGGRSENVVAFARVLEGEAVVVVAPRLVSGLVREDGALAFDPDAWGDATVSLSGLPGARYPSLFTGVAVEETNPKVGDLLSGFPAAVLVAG
ncbi:MAG: malto-oligosyltrehalose synthase [Rubrobacter sp.]|nr:malto-oligosyltrehalose synthase [Rubrobacter sp.]